MRQRYGASLLVTGLLISPGVLCAQDLYDGFWFSAGIGPSFNTSQGRDADRDWGYGLYVRGGGTTSRRLRLGAEVISWGSFVETTFIVRSNWTGAALFIPNTDLGFFIKGAAGLAVGGFAIERTGAANTYSWSTGFGSTVGVGWDFRVGRQLALTPNVDWAFQSLFGDDVSDKSVSIFFFTLGLTLP